MNTPSDDIMCYAVKYPPHPGYGTIIVDNPKYAKETAKEIAKAIRQGGLIERVSLQAAKDGLQEYLQQRKSNTPQQKDLTIEHPYV